MNKEFTTEELVELRCDLTYAAQKVANVIISRLSDQHRGKHPEHYSPDAITTAKKELELAQFQLRVVSDKMLPAIMTIAREASPV